MPQKLNKAGKMQDYIPAGNGDPSGEYGTSKGTNKNFTASDKKKTEANVINENKSVAVGDKKERIRKEASKKIQELHDISNRIIENPTKEDKDLFDKKMDEYEKWEKENSEKVIDYREYFKEKIETKGFKKDTKANIINDDLTGKDVPRGKSATRKDEYGNNLVSDEAFIKGYEAGKKYLDDSTKYYDKDKLLMSNVFLGYLTDEISKGITEAGLNEDFDLTYQDFSEIAGALLDRNVNYKEYEINGWRNPSKIYTGTKYTGYKPKKLK